MMAYIANKPVRFDRNYQVGEQIPMEAITPNMRKSCLTWVEFSVLTFQRKTKQSQTIWIFQQKN